jgi:hypothetical protein
MLELVNFDMLFDMLFVSESANMAHYGGAMVDRQ